MVLVTAEPEGGFTTQVIGVPGAISFAPSVGKAVTGVLEAARELLAYRAGRPPWLVPAS